MTFLSKFKYFSRWAILGTIIGIISGLGAVMFFILLQLSSACLIGFIGGYSLLPPGGEINFFSFTSTSMVSWRIPLILTIGGLISGTIVYRFAPEAEGHGTDAYISAFHYKNGRIRKRVPLIKAIASSIVIGSGGSAGREGPIAQIGAGFGSWLVTKFNLSDNDRRTAIICGAAGGIGAIFKAPLGGAIFAIEVLYKRDLEVKALLPSFISSIVAYSIFGLFFGFQPIFITPQFNLNIDNLPFYAILGLSCAGFAIIFTKLFYYIKDKAFAKLKVSKMLKPAIGCGLMGFIALFLPEVLGPGYGIIQLTIDDRYTLLILLIIIFAKIVVTSLTIGSGGSGGVFAPSLVIGSTIGGFIAILFRSLFPFLHLEIAAFTVVGMAAFITAVANVPIASIIMVSEMTNTHTLLVQSMLACSVAYIFSQKWSIYESQVKNQTYSPVHRGKYIKDILETLKARDIMNKDLISVNSKQTIKELFDLVKESGRSGFPVIDSGVFVGIIVYRDLFKIPPDKMESTYIESCMTKNVITGYPDDNAFDILDKIENYGYGRLPIVDPTNPHKILGIITKRDILRAREIRRSKLVLEGENESLNPK
jgi:CIC family chloride channel protein